MEKMNEVTRIHRGLFEIKNVLKLDDREDIYCKISGLSFMEPSSTSDQAFTNHPILFEECVRNEEKRNAESIKEKCISLLQSNTFVTKFCGTDKINVLRYFILQYRNTTKNKKKCFNTGLDYHLDKNDGKNNHNILSCVFTFRCPDCVGGELNYSNEECGGSYAIDSQKYEKYYPPDNSMYFFYGSYVKHSVSNVQIGKRYAVVFFLESIKTIKDIQLHWSKTIKFDKKGEIIKNEFCCKICDISYGSRQSFINHVNRTHKRETIVRKHQCSAIDCKKSYDLIESLNDHKRKKHKIFKWK